MTDTTRVVFDCNTFLQGLAAPGGPAGRCVQLAIDGKISLFSLTSVLAELHDVTSRPKVIAKMKLVPDRVEEFFTAIEVVSTLLDGYASVFDHPRDPDDADYVNLAVAAGAKYIVTRDNDLLDLMDASKPDAIEFQPRFAEIRVVNPVTFLQEIDARK